MHVTFTDLVENDDYGYEIKEPIEEPTENIGKTFVFLILYFHFFNAKSKVELRESDTWIHLY